MEGSNTHLYYLHIHPMEGSNTHLYIHPGFQVGRIVHAMKMGWIKPKPPTEDEEEDEPKFYHLWENESEVSLVCETFL